MQSGEGVEILYLDYMSQPSRAVLSVIELYSLQDKIKVQEVKIMEMAHRDASFSKINPNMKLPCYVDGELILFESSAIMRYICNKHLPGDNVVYPHGDRMKTARIEQDIITYHLYARPAARLIYGTFIAPMVGLEKLFDLPRESERAIKICTKLDDFFSKRKGEPIQPTIAVLLIFNDIMQLHSAGGWSLSTHSLPSIKAILSTILKHPSLQSTNAHLIKMIQESGGNIDYLLH